MPGIGFTEILLLAGIALVVIGPERFPDFAKIVVRTIRDLRGYMDEVKSELSKELKPVEKEMREITRHDPRQYTLSAASAKTGAVPPQTATPAAEAARTGEGAPDTAPKPPEEEPVTYGGGHLDGDPDGQPEYGAPPQEQDAPGQESQGGDFTGEFDPPPRLDG